jgi:hypothetical protein
MVMTRVKGKGTYSPSIFDSLPLSLSPLIPLLGGYRVHTSQFRIKKTLKVGEKMENPILIHAALIDSQAFGDPRLVKRGRRYTPQSANIRP